MPIYEVHCHWLGYTDFYIDAESEDEARRVAGAIETTSEDEEMMEFDIDPPHEIDAEDVESRTRGETIHAASDYPPED